jgi:hypothetical protein
MGPFHATSILRHPLAERLDRVPPSARPGGFLSQNEHPSILGSGPADRVYRSAHLEHVFVQSREG